MGLFFSNVTLNPTATQTATPTVFPSQLATNCLVFLYLWKR